MTWHYGVIRKTRRVKNKTYHYYEVHEIFDEKSWTESAIHPDGDNVKDLQVRLAMMLQDSIRYPVYEIRKGKIIRRCKVE